jgi:hypothetical protein
MCSTIQRRKTAIGGHEMLKMSCCLPRQALHCTVGALQYVLHKNNGNVAVAHISKV